MSSTSPRDASEWILPDADSAIDRIAIATYGSAGIPVPAEELLRSRLRVDQVEWPFAVDALMIWHQGTPSRVLIKSRPAAYERRVRMTFAHELGHVVIPWHVGYGAESCDSDVVDRVGGDYVRTQEGEARNFAGRLLIPFTELKRAAAGRGLQDFFDDLDRFEASAWATAMRLTQVLRPGFVLTGNFRDPSTVDLLRSRGTRSMSVAEASSAAVDHGQFNVGGKVVDWYKFADTETFRRSTDQRRPSEIVRSILMDVFPDADEPIRTKMFQSVQGVLGSALGDGAFESADSLLRMARQRVNTKVDRAVREHPDWDAYILKTVENRANKLGILT